MKTIFLKHAALLSIVMAGFACKSDNIEYDPGVAFPVEALILPADSYYVELASTTGAALDFEWDAATAEDGQLPMYEVVFMAEPGGEVAYRYSAGANNYVRIPHKELNKAASASGVALNSSGEFYWSVVSSRGISETMADADPFRITVKRLNGFENIPTQLFLTGTGTEAGDDLSKAIAMREVGEDGGEFEVYTELSAGEYRFVSATSGESRTFSVSTGEVAEADVATTVVNPGVYRLKLDFNTRNFASDVINMVEIYECDARVSHLMTYQGGGVWTTGQVTHSANGDDRYNFHAYVNGDTYNEKWGTTNPGIDGRPSDPNNAADTYFYVRALTGSYLDDNWGDKWKFYVAPAPNAANLQYTAWLYMTADDPSYTHKVTYP